MATNCSDIFDNLAKHQATAGYAIHNADAATGETVDDEGGADWWWTWTNGGDIEAGSACASMLDATGDAMAHWFGNARITRYCLID
jgi:hypothetical protein